MRGYVICHRGGTAVALVKWHRPHLLPVSDETRPDFLSLSAFRTALLGTSTARRSPQTSPSRDSPNIKGLTPKAALGANAPTHWKNAVSRFRRSVTPLPQTYYGLGELELERNESLPVVVLELAHAPTDLQSVPKGCLKIVGEAEMIRVN